MSLSTMNWKRGLLRLWAVAAVLWVGVAFYSNDTVQRVRDAYGPVVPVTFIYDRNQFILPSNARKSEI